MRSARLRTCAGPLAAGLLLAACSSAGGAGKVVTVTVPPNSASRPPTTGAGSSPATTTPPASATATATKLPGTCDTLLPDYLVIKSLGNVTPAGTSVFVVGVPDAAIGRLSTINCRYGVTGSGAAAKTKVEIGVSLYANAAQAAARIAATTADYTAHGATSRDVALPAAGTTPAATAGYLTGGVGTGYDLPLLVVATDRRTVAVTIDPAAVRTPPADQAAVALAQLALQRTAS